MGMALALAGGMKNSTLDRREFTRISLLSMFAGVTVTIAPACGGGGGGSNSPNNPSTPPPTTASGDKTAAISSNHGHVCRITAAQMQAGGAVRLSLGGSVGTTEHTHAVELTAAEVSSVSSGARVSKTSSVDDTHDHVVTFN
jgi:hypothetical protein